MKKVSVPYLRCKSILTGRRVRYDQNSTSYRLLATVIVTFLLLSLLPVTLQAQTWYNTTWSYRKTITIDFTKVGAGPHTNFPVLISMADADLQTKAQTNANDILFTSSDGTTKLNHEIENYTSASGTIVAWVEIPSLSSSANTVIYMYYGNATAPSQQNVTGTWNANFKGVYHLNNAFLDATSNNFDGTNTHTTNVAGKIANGSGFNPTNGDGADYVTVTGLMGSPSSYTLSAWANLITIDPNAADIISLGDHSVLRYDVSNGKVNGVGQTGAATWVTTMSSTNYATGWHYVVYTFDNAGNSQQVYVDGQPNGAATTVTASPYYTGGGTNTFIGKHGNANTGMDFYGTIDEAHVSNSVRSAGWILTEYNNQNSPSTFYSVGGEAKPYYSRANGNWNSAATWSNTGHGGAAASTTPGNVSGDYVIIGSSDIITLNVNVTFQTAVDINSTGTLNLGVNTISNAGTFSLNSGGTLGIGSTAGITSSGATGNVQVTGTRIFSAGSNYIYNGTLAQVTGNGLPATVNNLTINNSAGVTLSAGVAVSLDLTITSGIFDLGNYTANRASAGGTLTVSNGATLRIGGTNTLPSNYSTHSIGATSTIEYSGTTQSIPVLNSAQSYGNLIISGSGTKTLAGNENVTGNLTISAGTLSANNFNIAVGGNWVNNAAFTAGTGSVTFNGGGAQIVSGSQALNLFNLVTNNSSGITLNTNLAVSGAHTFTAGIITTSATPNYLIYNAGSSYSGDADNKHVNGWVKKFGSTNFVFPVGNGIVERKAALNSLSVNSEFNAKYLAATPFTNLLQLPLFNIAKLEYWSINKVSGGTATVTLNWDYSKVNFSNWIVSDIVVTGYNGLLWINNGGIAAGNTATTGTITSNSIASFNLFTFASKSFILPLTLISFTAKRQDNLTELAWTTASELNVNRFVAERSDDNIHFYTIGELQARNSPNQENYSIRDNRAINGNAYYRLRCIDNDNKEKLSQVVLVRDISTNKVLTLAVNPLDGQLVLQATTGLNGLFDYRVLTMSGQLMQQGEISIQNGGQYKLSLKGNLVPGIYLLNVTDSRQNFSFKIIKK